MACERMSYSFPQNTMWNSHSQFALCLCFKTAITSKKDILPKANWIIMNYYNNLLIRGINYKLAKCPNAKVYWPFLRKKYEFDDRWNLIRKHCSVCYDQINPNVRTLYFLCESQQLDFVWESFYDFTLIRCFTYVLFSDILF